MLGFEINQNKRGILFVEWPEKIEKFGIGNEIYIKLEDKIECRLAKIHSNDQNFLGALMGSNSTTQFDISFLFSSTFLTKESSSINNLFLFAL